MDNNNNYYYSHSGRYIIIILIYQTYRVRCNVRIKIVKLFIDLSYTFVYCIRPDDPLAVLIKQPSSSTTAIYSRSRFTGAIDSIQKDPEYPSNWDPIMNRSYPHRHLKRWENYDINRYWHCYMILRVECRSYLPLIESTEYNQQWPNPLQSCCVLPLGKAKDQWPMDNLCILIIILF